MPWGSGFSDFAARPSGRPQPQRNRSGGHSDQKGPSSCCLWGHWLGGASPPPYSPPGLPGRLLGKSWAGGGRGPREQLPRLPLAGPSHGRPSWSSACSPNWTGPSAQLGRSSGGLSLPRAAQGVPTRPCAWRGTSPPHPVCCTHSMIQRDPPHPHGQACSCKQAGRQARSKHSSLPQSGLSPTPQLPTGRHVTQAANCRVLAKGSPLLQRPDSLCLLHTQAVQTSCACESVPSHSTLSSRAGGRAAVQDCTPRPGPAEPSQAQAAEAWRAVAGQAGVG